MLLTNFPVAGVSDSFVFGEKLVPLLSARAVRTPDELAVNLYAQGHLPMGKATELAQMTRREFMQLIQEREICRPFDDEELERELSW